MMDKEEVLAKSRQSHKDEGMEHAENQGRRIGLIAFTLLFAFLAICSLFFWQISTLYALLSLFWAYFSAEAYGKYRFIKRKEYLITVIFGSIASIVFAAAYLLATLRK